MKNVVSEQSQQHQKKIQQLNQELTQKLEEVNSSISQDIKNAHKLSLEAEQIADELISVYDEMYHQNVIGAKAPVLLSIGETASMLGDVKKAQKAFEDTRSLIGNYPTPYKATLWEDLGYLYYVQDFFKEAQSYYQQAFDEYIMFEFWEGAARTKLSVANCALEQGARADFLRHLDEGIEFSREHALDEWERKGENMKSNLLVGWDITGEAAEKIGEKVNQTEE